MVRLGRLMRIGLVVAMGAMLLGLPVQAQEGFDFFAAEETAAGDDLWVKLAALKETLDESVVTSTGDVASLAETASGLLLGTEEEAGVIALVQELAGVEDYEAIDAEGIVEAGVDAPELIALAHLVLAARAVEAGADLDSLLQAGEHVREADRLLAHLNPETAQ